MCYRAGWGYSKEFFNGSDARNYFAAFHGKMKSEVDQMSDGEIVSCNFEEWAGYLAGKYYIAPISVFETNIEKTLAEKKVKRANPFRGHPFEKDFFEIDGVRVTFKIPFDGEPDLFDIQPSSRILSRFATQSFVAPQGEECGSFTLDFEYTKQELQDKGEAMAEYVQKQFDNEFRSYKTMIGYVNAEVASFNNGLVTSAMRLLEERKKKADSFSAISNALQIPLTTSKNAPNTKPIQLKRIVRQPSVKPTVKPATPEPYISDSDYENINNIISMCGTTMEKTARTYFANTEEELRDHLLAALNTHYEAATGETFRKIGKTDIHIEFENKAAFIGECKIWHGERLFQGAIHQVISYSTWRDLKVSVIIFNKENQSFPAILSKIKCWADANTTAYTQPQANIWKCKYHRQDIDNSITLRTRASLLHDVLNLYIDGNYTLFNCTAPIQIEGMFADFLYAANTFKRFTDMDLFERDVLNIKLKKLTECSEVDLEVVEYFEFYFTNLVRNRAAHGRYIKASDAQDDEILAKELLLDMKCLTHQIRRKAEVERMLRCVQGYLDCCNMPGTSSPDAIYGALYGDFTGRRMHLSYDSLEQYNPIQFLYWIINPYYEKIFQTMSVDDEVKKIRGYLYSEDFWRYTYNKIQQDMLLGRKFDPDVNSAVKCMFKCPLTTESKRWLGKIHNILNDRKNT